jgi:hypothetical protein
MVINCNPKLKRQTLKNDLKKSKFLRKFKIGKLI